jgi:uncharacterized protein DUF6086
LSRTLILQHRVARQCCGQASRRAGVESVSPRVDSARAPHRAGLGWPTSSATGPAERFRVSQYYRLGEMTLWNPSTGTSRLFLRHVALFEEELGLPSGIGPMEADEAQISPEPLKTFVAALLEWRGRTNHAVITALSDGFVATLLVLAERAGVVAPWSERTPGNLEGMHDVQVVSGSGPVIGGGDCWSRMLEQARQVAQFMAR